MLEKVGKLVDEVNKLRDIERETKLSLELANNLCQSNERILLTKQTELK